MKYDFKTSTAQQNRNDVNFLFEVKRVGPQWREQV